MESQQLTHAVKALRKWRGENARLVAYSPTRRVGTLALEHEFLSVKGYLQVILGGCSRVEMPTVWKNSCIVTSDVEQTKQLKLEDYSAGVPVVCTEIAVKLRLEKFWDSVL